MTVKATVVDTPREEEPFVEVIDKALEKFPDMTGGIFIVFTADYKMHITAQGSPEEYRRAVHGLPEVLALCDLVNETDSEKGPLQ